MKKSSIPYLQLVPEIPDKAQRECPRIGVRAVVTHADRVLLVRRGIPPSFGRWAFPGGIMRIGESINETAEREIMEETGITIKIDEPVRTFDFMEHKEMGGVHHHYVIIDLSAKYISGVPKANDDALEARWVCRKDLESYDVTDSTKITLARYGFLNNQVQDPELQNRSATLCLDPFLRETFYCDYREVSIKKLASRLTENSRSDVDRAVTFFYWVRDSIRYRIGYWQRKATDTLREMEGTCTNKSNILIALLRASGIPAGYGVMEVTGEYLGPIVPPGWKGCVSNRTRHVYTCAFLNGRWVKCDPSDDRDFSEQISHFNPQYNLIDWNGIEDSIIRFDQNHIIRDDFPLNTIDYLIEKRARMPQPFMNIGNLYIKFLRNSKERYYDIKVLQSSFNRWLLKNKHSYYFISITARHYSKLKNYSRLSNS